MRHFAKFPPSFWTGEQARGIRAIADPAERSATFLVGAYLKTNPHATMLGLYRLPLPFVVHELGLDLELVKRALDHLDDLGFALYDYAAETVWVLDMAREQVLDGSKTALAPTDHKVKACRSQYAAAPRCEFLKPFFARYRDVLLLDAGRDPVQQTRDLFDLGIPEGASKPPPGPLPGEGEGEGQAPRVLGAAAAAPRSSTSKEPREIPHRAAGGKSKGVLQGENLDRFETFWAAFAYKDGKNDAVGAWIEARIDDELFEAQVLPAALAEAARRPELKNRGQTPIMAQGWISRRRFDDESLLEAGRLILKRKAEAEFQAAQAARTEAPALTEAQVLHRAVLLAETIEGAQGKREDETVSAFSRRIHLLALKKRLRIPDQARST